MEIEPGALVKSRVSNMRSSPILNVYRGLVNNPSQLKNIMVLVELMLSEPFNSPLRERHEQEQP